MKITAYLYILIICTFLICASTTVSAQNTVFKNYSVNEGLPSSECYWVMQDSRHFLWIATDAGVVKYDGYTFVTYNSSKGLPDNTVFKIHEDNYGRIWFATYSGKLAYYSYSTDSIYSIPVNKDISNIVKYLPTDFCFDNKDTLWVSLQLEGFIKIIPPHYKTFVKYHLPEQGFFIKECDNDSFIYGSDGKAKRLKGSLPFYFITQNNKYREVKPGYRIFQIVNLTSAVKTGAASYLFSNDNAVYNVSDNNMDELINLKNISSIVSLYKDSKNKIWLSTKTSALSFNDNKLSRITEKLFTNDIISSVAEDKDNGYWYTTTNNGINYIPSLNFKYYNKDCGLTSNKVYDIAILNNKIYCSVNDLTLNILDLKTKTFTYKTDNLYSYVFGFDNKLLFNHNNTEILNLNDNSIVSVRNINNNEELFLKNVIEFDADFLVGYDLLNVVKINKNTGFANLLVSVPSRIFSIYKDENRIFIGTKKGLYKFENNKLIFLGDSIPLLTNRIEAITCINNTLFIATKGFGVLCYKNNEIINHFNETNGLASNICKCITKDSEGNIWVGTNRGVSRLRSDKNGKYVCNSLNLSNGLISNEINQIIEYKNELYFATNSGIGIFNIKEAFDKNKSIPVYIENFLVNNAKLNFRQHHRLKYNENFIKINYKGVYLKNEGDITYKYKLAGLDTSWTFTKNTFVQYTTLPAGNYAFIVYALNSNDALSAKAAIINFSIKSPFWKTWWFYTLIISFISALIFLLYKRRIKMIKKAEAQKALDNIKIAESELKALRSQMNPHFIFNAINSIQNFVIKNESLAAQKYLTKFSKLIRSVLENSKYETILLTKEIEALTLYLELETLRASFGFDYEIIISEDLKRKPMYIPTMLIQPYIENAILHGLSPLTGRRGKINLTIEENSAILVCKIDDNGIGRAKARKIKQKKDLSHQSMGMSVTNERIHNMNKYTSIHTAINIIDKYDENDLPMGTNVILEIKI